MSENSNCKYLNQKSLAMKKLSYNKYYSSNMFKEAIQSSKAEGPKNSVLTPSSTKITQTNKPSNTKFKAKYEDDTTTPFVRKVKNFYTENNYTKNYCNDSKSRASSRGAMGRDFYE